MTKAGQQEPILGELCGRMLLDSLLKSIPENTNTNEQQQFIGMAERLGVFMAYVLTRNLMFTRNQLRKQMARDKNEWLNQVINTDYLMDWFTNKFISKKNGRETTTYKNLMTILKQHSPEYYRKLVNAEMEFNKPLIKKNYEQIRKRVDNN